MTDELSTSQVAAPSMKQIAVAAFIAMIVAGIVLTTAILPAEFGIDPLGTGKKLGLTGLADAAGAPKLPAEFAEATILPVLAPEEQKSRWGVSGVIKGAFLSQPARFNFDSREFILMPGEGVEYKYNMKQGAGLVFSWESTGKVLFDFHGQPNIQRAGKSSDFYETFEIDDQVGKDRLRGTLVAPRSGIQGWFWENTSQAPVTIKLTAAGFFDWVFQNVDDKQSALEPIDVNSLPSHPKLPDEIIP